MNQARDGMTLCDVEPDVCAGNFSETTLRLDSFGMVGTLPTQLGLITQLRSLLLSNNHISGTIPSLDALVALEELVLDANAMSGTLPLSVAPMQLLSVVSAAQNHLSGSLPALWSHNAGALSSITLDTNSISQHLPTEWAALAKLETLAIQGNDLRGTIPREWSALSQLRTFHMYSNAVSGTLPTELGKLGALVSCRLGAPGEYKWDNMISGYLPTELGQLGAGALDDLGLGAYRVSGTIPTELGNLMTSIRGITISGKSSSKLSGTLPTEYGRLDKLMSLFVSETRVSGTVPDAWTSLSPDTGRAPLENLDTTLLILNKLSGTLHKGWSELRRLHTFDVAQNSLSGTLPLLGESSSSPLAPLLESFTAGGNRLSGTLPQNPPRSLQRLSFYENALSGTFPRRWGTTAVPLDRLDHLDLSDNAISGTVPDAWRNLFTDASKFNLCRIYENAVYCPLPLYPLACVELLDCEWPSPKPPPHPPYPPSPPCPPPPSHPPPHFPPPTMPPTPTRPQVVAPTPTLTLLLTIIAAITVLAGLCGVLLWRRRRRGGRQTPLLSTLGGAEMMLPLDEHSGQLPLHIHTALGPGVSPADGDELSMRDFELLGFLGSGSVGRVYLVRRRDAGMRLYALKTVPKKGLKEIARAKEERRILQELSHPFIVSLHYAFEDGESMYLALSYAGNGDLLSHLDKNGCVSETAARVTFAEVVSALGYLHSKWVIYRDVKPENVLIGQDGNILLADFGISKRLLSVAAGSAQPLPFSALHQADASPADAETAEHEVITTRTMVGTPEYMSPEVVQRKSYSFSADWWSAGVLLYEMLLGHTPFAGANINELFARLRDPSLHISVEEFEGEEADAVSPVACELIESLLIVDEPRRLGSRENQGAHDVAAHPFFDGLDWDKLLEKDGTIPPPFPIRPLRVADSNREPAPSHEPETHITVSSTCSG